jgi:hypothetical protein
MITFNFITGFMVGFELIAGKDLENYDVDENFLVIDLFIVRFTFIY